MMERIDGYTTIWRPGRGEYREWPWPLRVRGMIESIVDAKTICEDFVDDLNARGCDLHLARVLEFEYSYYAIVAENDTGMGAMEVVIDRGDDRARPEPGPNMMWNTRYSMRGGRDIMLTQSGGVASIMRDEARQIGQRHLDGNLPGREAGEPDAFHGYYTLHYLRDGRIEGILSVHGDTGDVWYHHWHGRFMSALDVMTRERTTIYHMAKGR
jgi:hypothetical protein